MTLAQVEIPFNSRARSARGSAIRTFDLLLACTGLIIAAPLMLLVAIAIWLDSGRPIFFSQIRLGEAGRHFRIYKFRKFHRDAGVHGCGLTLKGDSRMTRIGRVLARTKLDELPQLWNVLKGDMAIVGPRPESLKFADCFQGRYLALLGCKPGVFGPSQWHFRDENAMYPTEADPEWFYREVLFPLKAAIDLSYFSHRTFARDTVWIFRCVLAVVGLQTSPLGGDRSSLANGDWQLQQSHREIQQLGGRAK